MSLMAAPARRQPRQEKRPDGSAVTVVLQGDEWCHWESDLAGNLLVRDDEGCYRLANADELAQWETDKARGLMQREQVNARRMQRLSNLRHASAQRTLSDDAAQDNDTLPDTHCLTTPFGGRMRGIVVLVEFQDRKFSTVDDPLQHFTDLMNKEGFDYAISATSKYKHYGSVRDYFVQNSNGWFEPQFDVFGPLCLKNEASYYGKGSSDSNAYKVIVEACDQLDSLAQYNINFADYDNNGDGTIDFIVAIYAGTGANATGASVNDIWPHSWDIYSASGGRSYSYDDIKLDEYACINEEFSGKPDGIGTMCHEFSHILGLPDLYNTVSASNTCSPCDYDLMDSGMYNCNSYHPAGMSSYERYELGWMQQPLPLDSVGPYQLEEFGTTEQAYIVPVTEGLDDPRDGEYYLFENRQQTGWDKYLPGHGMLVWHIDYKSSLWSGNTPNNWPKHQCVDLIEADGQKKDSSGSLYQDDTTPFPGTSLNTSFTDDTTPAFSGWTSPGTSVSTLENRLCKAITNIREVAAETEGAPSIITFDYNVVTEGIRAVQIDNPVVNGLIWQNGRLMISTPDGQTDLLGRK